MNSRWGLLLLALVLGLTAAGCGASGPRPVTVTDIPDGTTTIPIGPIGSLYVCKSGESARSIGKGARFTFHAPRHPYGMGVWDRNGKFLVACTG